MHTGYNLGKMKNQKLKFEIWLYNNMCGGRDTSLKSCIYPKMLKLLVLCLRPDFLHAGYFLGKVKNQNLIFMNLTTENLRIRWNVHKTLLRSGLHLNIVAKKILDALGSRVRFLRNHYCKSGLWAIQVRIPVTSNFEGL